MRELRRHRRIHGQAADFALLQVHQQISQAIHIHGFGEHVFHHFIHQRMIGNLNVTDDIFLASSDVGKHRGQQIVGPHALDLGRNFLAALEAQKRQSAVGVPAPAGAKNGGSQRRLLQDGLDGLGIQKMKHVRQRKTVLLRQSDVQAVLGRGGLQFEVEAAAETLAQSQPPRFVDAATKRAHE